MKLSHRLFVCVLLIAVLTSCYKKEKASCKDGLKNQNELYADCGGVCKPCETCWDGIRNQDEVFTDCGGICPSCGTCSDGLLNQNETAIDCGGVCPSCPTCDDMIQNQGETGIDCGGPCAPCPPTFTIIYPESGDHGYNILCHDTVQYIRGSASSSQLEYRYSFAARVPKDIHLKVVMTKLAGTWGYRFPLTTWNVIFKEDHMREFQTVGEISADVALAFAGTGKALMEIFEHQASVPTRTKVIYWRP
jgi:hypothetical protein